MFKFSKKDYKPEGLASQLIKADPYRYKDSVKYAAKMIEKGWIGRMTRLRGGSMEKEIKDPNYVPLTGEVFGLWDGMYGTDTYYQMTSDGLKIAV